MSIKPVFVFACILVTVGFADVTLAQRAKIRLNQDFRYLGGFQSAGYHWRNPGPCIGYYNPYSQHNSYLKSGGIPQGAELYLRSGLNHSPMTIHQPSAFEMGPAPGVGAPIPKGNSVPAFIDDSPEKELPPADLKSLEEEVQSILDDKPQSNQKEAPQDSTKVPADESTTLWNGYNKNVHRGVSMPRRVGDQNARTGRTNYQNQLRMRIQSNR